MNRKNILQSIDRNLSTDQCRKKVLHTFFCALKQSMLWKHTIRTDTAKQVNPETRRIENVGEVGGIIAEFQL